MRLLNLLHRPVLPVAILASLLATQSRAQNAAAAAEMATAANRLLQSLDPDQRARAVFAMDAAERLDWHFIPRERLGLPLKDMRPEQAPLAHALLATALSHRGHLQAATIMSLEAILKEMEKGTGPVRDPAAYFVSIFGEPNPHHPWAWRVEGHHLSINMVVAGKDGISATPSFFGSNPARVPAGPREGLRALGEEEDLGRALVHSLSKAQRRTAIVAETAPRDVILDPSQSARPLEPLGLPASQMDGPQRDRLRAIIRQYLYRYRAEVADAAWKRIDATGWDKVHFAWAGGIEPGQGHYYRVQGATFVLEYDDTQNNANHIHSVWRDLQDDFGVDLLKRHYAEGGH
ncbi:MAG: DUF3500 domain-containing protein [Verrucomicrobiae bacterium]|nr:DUF3500 domain-containing protein [Verrucomicrobiae bacterium]